MTFFIGKYSIKRVRYLLWVVFIFFCFSVHSNFYFFNLPEYVSFTSLKGINCQFTFCTIANIWSLCILYSYTSCQREKIQWYSRCIAKVTSIKVVPCKSYPRLLRLTLARWHARVSSRDYKNRTAWRIATSTFVVFHYYILHTSIPYIDGFLDGKFVHAAKCVLAFLRLW